MSQTINKIQLLNDMRLDALALGTNVGDFDWKSAHQNIDSLLKSIETLESLLHAETLPKDYTEKCTCLNCIPPTLNIKD